jgi:hypothetical protein
MRQQIIDFFDKAANRAFRPMLFKARNGSFDVLEVASLKACFESAEYYEKHLIQARPFQNDLELLSHAASLAKPAGLWLEFGVASGRTISHLASQHDGNVYGFDSFEGLPENWRSGYPKGQFAGALPPVPDNASLIKGWFDKTLPMFLREHREDLSFLHVDCDLYSSTKTIFELLGARMKPGTVIVFDEYWNYPGWKEHEYRALEEFKIDSGKLFSPIGFVPSHQQVAFIAD